LAWKSPRNTITIVIVFPIRFSVKNTESAYDDAKRSIQLTDTALHDFSLCIHEKNRTAAVLYVGIGGAEESSREPVIITRIRSAGIYL
jgi:hypothetical protein